MFTLPTSIQDSPVSGMTAGKAAIIWKENQSHFMKIAVKCRALIKIK